ncbi:MAG: hypothetical protein ACK5KP_10350, partial [Paludibacteraceae bacterium]
MSNVSPPYRHSINGVKIFSKTFFGFFLSINARVNFLQLQRYGNHNEARYRQQFERKFDFLTFNLETVQQFCGTRKAIAFDPGYIPKSGKYTTGAGYFW